MQDSFELGVVFIIVACIYQILDIYHRRSVDGLDMASWLATGKTLEERKLVLQKANIRLLKAFNHSLQHDLVDKRDVLFKEIEKLHTNELAEYRRVMFLHRSKFLKDLQ